MKESVDFKDLTKNEQLVREQNKATLESLPGFSRLAKNQKRYILNSLYIQQRAERGTDPASASRIQEIPEEFKLNAPNGTYIFHSKLGMSSEKDRYFPSQLHIMNEFCHQVIAKLEEYGKDKNSNNNWCEVGPIKTYTDLEELINLSEGKLPFVIEIWDKKPAEKNSAISHTTLLLGKNSEDEFILWEKSGFHMPFQLVSLKKVYEAYAKQTGWRIRPLSV